MNSEHSATHTTEKWHQIVGDNEDDFIKVEKEKMKKNEGENELAS